MLEPEPTRAPAPAAPAPLSKAEQARLHRQIAGLRHIDALDRSHARAEWDRGSYCRRVRDEGLWRRSPEHAAPSFLDFVTRVTSLRSRSTVERRLALVEHYGREEFLEYLAAGTGATALVEITRAEATLRPLLLELAREGLTVAEVGLLRGAGRALLRRAARPAPPPLRERLRGVLGEARQEAEERRKNGGRGAGRGAAAKARDEGPGAEAAIEARRRELEERARALAAREAELQERERRLEAPVVPEAPAPIAAPMPEPAPMIEEDDPQARGELDAERAELDLRAERLAQDEERLRRDRAQLDAERLAVLGWLRGQHRIEWPRPPRTLDETLLLVDDHLEEVAQLAAWGRGQCDRERQDLKAGLPLLFALRERLKAVEGAMQPLLKDLALDYRARHPKEADAQLAARVRAAEAGEAPPGPAPPRVPDGPPQEFRLPTAAILGTPEPRSPQHGVLGFTRDRRALVTLDMNGVQTVGIFGQQGAGKSNTILVLSENALGPIPGVSVTPAPMAVIHCHYHADADGYAPGFARFFAPNDEPGAAAVLREDLHARPQALAARRRLILVPPMDEAELRRRRAEYAGAEVRPLSLSARELGMEGLRLLMGAGRGAQLYMMKIHHALQELRGGDPTPEEFRDAIGRVRLPAQVREIVEARLRLIERLVGPEPLGERIGPGDFVGLDMRAPWMDEGVAMALFAVATSALGAARGPGGAPLRKMVVFDEAHKYMGKGVLSADILKKVREMRHLGMWVVYASQDPESVHPALIKLSSVLVVHQLKARSSVKALREQFAGCEALDAGDLSQMARGEARVLAVDCAELAYRSAPQPVIIRPSCAHPGGTTRPAVS